MADRKHPKEAFLLAKGKVNFTMETKGTGSLVQLEKDKPKGKCRKWQLRVSVGMDPRTGRYRQRTRTFSGTYTEAKRALPDFISELSGQTMTKSGKVPTFEECADEWLDHRSRTHEVKETSIEGYRTRLHMLSRLLGSMRTDKLTSSHVQDALLAMMNGDTASGKPAGAQYIKMLWIAGKTMYKKYAIPNGYATENPFEGVSSPSVEPRQQVVLDEEEYQRLASKMRPVRDGYRMGVLLALLAGLRLGECCSLTWQDWQGGKLHVNGTKTKAANATVPISQALQDALGEWMERQSGDMIALGLPWDRSMPIVTNPTFQRMPNDSLTVWWLQHRYGFGFPGIRFHDLRHAFVARCCMLNLNPKVIQKLARHSTFSVTMDIYAAVNDSALEEAVAGL